MSGLDASQRRNTATQADSMGSTPTVAELAARGVEQNLKLLNAQWTGSSPSPFTADDIQHAQSVLDEYKSEHPLGFLADSSPIIAQSMMHDALRKNTTRLMDVYNSQNGDFRNARSQLASLQFQHEPEDFIGTVNAVFSTIHRDVLERTTQEFKGMARAADDGLWYTYATDERRMSHEFHDAASQLEAALKQFDQGNIQGALSTLNTVLRSNQPLATQFRNEANVSNNLKFGAHLGIALGAGFAAFWTGGTTLAALGGTEAGLGGLAASTLVSGLTVTTVNNGLSSIVFNRPFITTPGTPFDKSVAFTGDVLRNSALMGWMRMGSTVVESIVPAVQGETVFATAANAASSYSVDFANLTSFNVMASASHFIDENAPSAVDVLSPEVLAENALFLAGMKGGNAGIRGSAELYAKGLNLWLATSDSAQRAMQNPYFRTAVLSPLAIMMGIPGAGVPGAKAPGSEPDQPIGDGFRALTDHFAHPGTDAKVADLCSMFLTENWLVLTALTAIHLGIPKTTTAIKVSGGRFDGSHPLFASLEYLLSNPTVRSDADFILREGLATYYGNSNVRAQMPTTVRMSVDNLASTTAMPNPIEASQQFLIAASKVQALIAQTSAAIASGKFIIGTKLQTMTLGNEIEVAAPDYDPDPPSNNLFLDPMMKSLVTALQAKGYHVETVEGKEPAFTAKVMDPANPGTMPYPFVFNYFSTANGRYFVAETYRGTGAYLITLKEIDPTTRVVLSSKTQHLRHVRNANGDFQLDANGKKVPIGSVADCRIPILKLLGTTLNFEDPIADVNNAIAATEITTRTGFLLLVKGIDNDILKVRVEVDFDTKMATLTTPNGKFIIPGLDKVYLPDLKRSDENATGLIMRMVTDEIRQRISGKRFALKNDRIELVKVSRTAEGGGAITLQIVNEAHPFAEIISGIMTPDVINIWQDAIETMKALGWKGTVDDRLIGRHVHLGVAGKTTSGRWTLRPLTYLTRAIPEWAPYFRELFPSNGNRAGFNQPQAEEVNTLFNSPHFEPENPDHILLAGLTIAGFNPQKYMGFNPDNIVSKVIRSMIQDGTLEKGSTREFAWEGQPYKFSIKGMTREETIQHLVSEGHDINTLTPDQIDHAEYHSYDVVGTLPDGRSMSIMRVPSSADKWTWEARFPDTVMDGAHDTFLMRSFMAFMYEFGHSPLYPTIKPTGPITR